MDKAKTYCKNKINYINKITELKFLVMIIMYVKLKILDETNIFQYKIYYAIVNLIQGCILKYDAY